MMRSSLSLRSAIINEMLHKRRHPKPLNKMKATRQNLFVPCHTWNHDVRLHVVKCIRWMTSNFTVYKYPHYYFIWYAFQWLHSHEEECSCQETWFNEICSHSQCVTGWRLGPHISIAIDSSKEHSFHKCFFFKLPVLPRESFAVFEHHSLQWNWHFGNLFSLTENINSTSTVYIHISLN